MNIMKTLKISLLFSILPIFLIFNSCKSPCDAKDAPNCGDHGTCVEVDSKTAKCECDEGWTGDMCSEQVNNDPCANSNAGTLQIIVKRKATGEASNNNGCLAVLGRSKEDMYLLDYKSSKLPGYDKPKFNLQEYDQLKTNGAVIDTAYSRKNGTDPANQAKVGIITFENIPYGTYYLHAFDGDHNKYVSDVTISKCSQLVYAETESLGNLKITISQTSVGGRTLDSNLYMVFAPGNDTLKEVSKKDVSSIAITPFYQGRSAELTNENGNKEPGIAFLYDIPTRQYQVLIYNDLFAPTNGTQGHADVQVKRNLLAKVGVHF
ncbi:hypothetical protein GC194_01345 [bacterium]|nr:hypothetical protein [bacterium]